MFLKLNQAAFLLFLKTVWSQDRMDHNLPHILNAAGQFLGIKKQWILGLFSQLNRIEYKDAETETIKLHRFLTLYENHEFYLSKRSSDLGKSIHREECMTSLRTELINYTYTKNLHFKSSYSLSLKRTPHYEIFQISSICN